MEDIRSSKEFVILGAGGLARELESWFVSSNLNKEYVFLGFLDDKKESLDFIENNYKVLDKIGDFFFQNYNNVVIGVTNINLRKKIHLLETKKKLFSILPFIHSSVILGNNIKIEKGIIICPNSVITCNVKIKEGVFINCNSTIGHDVTIGNFVTIMANVNIGGETIIEDEVFIGTGAIVFPRIKIAKGSIIGAGAVIVKTIREPGTYFGNPAKRIF